MKPRESRSSHGGRAVCGARTKGTGLPCRRAPLRGATRCGLHGGLTPQSKAAAEKRLARAEAVRAVAQLGLPVDVSPDAALLAEVQRCAGLVAYYQARVEEIAALGAEGLVWGHTRMKLGGEAAGDTYEARPSVWLQLFSVERDRLVKDAAAAIKAGIQERQVKLAESQGVLVAAVLKRILVRLNLTDAQAALIPTVVPEELRQLTADESPRPALEVVR